MRRFVLAGIALLLLGAHGGADEPDGSEPFPFMVRDTGATRFALEEAQRHVAAREFAKATEEIQEVLDQRGDDWYRTEARPESTRWRFAPEVARDLVAALPPEGRAAYQSRVRDAATPLVSRAMERRDRAGLREALLRYGASEEGRRAGRLLAADALAEGRFREAAWTARETLRFARDDAGLWALLVDALAGAGDAGALAALEPPAGLRTSVGGANVSVEERLTVARGEHPADVPLPGWPTWGGTPAHDGLHLTLPVFPTPRRWVQPLGIRRREQDDEQRTIREDDIPYRFDALWAAHRPVHVVSTGRVAYAADGLSIRAVDLYAGRAIWTFDASSPSPLAVLRGSSLSGRTSLERAFAPVVVDDLVVATVEVDRPYEPERLQNVEISSYQPQRVLVAVDRRDGRFRWTASADPADRRLLEGLSVAGPPAVADGLVVALLSRHQGLHNLAAAGFDLATGRLRWRRTIGSGQQELNLFGNPVKELAAGALAVADGVAYAWTGLGNVVAFEVLTGRPRWLASYRIQPIEPVQYWFRPPLRLPRTAPGPTIVHGDAVVVAPSDGEDVYAYDRRDGRLLWRHPLERDEFRISSLWHLVGVARDGRRDLVVVAGSEVRALDLATGTLAWRGRYEDDVTFAVGQGAIAGDQVLVPTPAGIQRFSLRSEGKLEAADPWPEGAAPGNLLPVAQVLLVAGRQELQAFYSWEEIRRDLDRRRRERPDDAEVLLEAGEVYRLGGEHDLARRAYQDALRVAKDPTSREGRLARAGLHATFVAIGDAARTTNLSRALDAYRHALPWADTPEQRVEMRLRVDATLEGSTPPGDVAGRTRNLEEMIAEAESAQAVFDPEEGPVPARAAAMLRLARLLVGQGRAAAAVDVLQRVLREEGDAAFPEGPARRRARAAVTEVVAAFGPEAYRAHERRAKELLTTTESAPDPAALDRLLREYPNATVVPEALLRLGRRLVASDAATATAVLRRLLSEHPQDARVAEATALLARAEGARGATGTRRFALARMAGRYGDASFELDGRPWTGRTYAEAERGAAATPPAPREVVPPVREVGFEQVGDEEFPRAVTVSADPEEPCPLGLLGNGPLLAGIDLTRSSVSFRVAVGTVSRAAFAEGVLVVAVQGALRGLSPRDGRTLWEVPIEGFAPQLETSRGLVFAVVRATTASAARRLVAVEPALGELVWSADLGPTEVNLLLADGDVLLERTRAAGGAPGTLLDVRDGLTGGERDPIRLPAGRVDREIAVAGPDLLVVARDSNGTRQVAALTVATGQARWRRALPRGGAPCEIVLDHDRAWLLHPDGRLLAISLASGETLHETRLYAGEGVHACPYPGTNAIVHDGRLLFVPWVSGREPATRALAYDLRTGKLAFESRFPPGRQASKVTFLRSGSTMVFGLVFQGPSRGMAIRLFDATSGATRQEIEPAEMAEDWVPSVTEGFGTILIYGRSGVALYAGRPADAK